jgi:hypothetical protein
MERLRERLEYGWEFAAEEDANDRITMDCVRTVLNTQAKVDDTQLRRRQQDMMPRLLAILAEQEKKMPAVVLDLG